MIKNIFTQDECFKFWKFKSTKFFKNIIQSIYFLNLKRSAWVSF